MTVEVSQRCLTRKLSSSRVEHGSKKPWSRAFVSCYAPYQGPFVGSGRPKFGGFSRSCFQEPTINRMEWLPSFQSDRATIRWRARGRGNAGASYRASTRQRHEVGIARVVVKIARQRLDGSDRIEKTVNPRVARSRGGARAKKHLSAGRHLHGASSLPTTKAKKSASHKF